MKPFVWMTGKSLTQSLKLDQNLHSWSQDNLISSSILSHSSLSPIPHHSTALSVAFSVPPLLHTPFSNIFVCVCVCARARVPACVHVCTCVSRCVQIKASPGRMACAAAYRAPQRLDAAREPVPRRLDDGIHLPCEWPRGPRGLFIRTATCPLAANLRDIRGANKHHCGSRKPGHRRAGDGAPRVPRRRGASS